VSVNLEVASATATVLVESGANVLQTESSQISGTFEGKSISDIPVQSGAFLSVLNLAIFLPNTTTQIGGTSGTGGSIGVFAAVKTASASMGRTTTTRR